MEIQTSINKISNETKQKISECISEAVGEDYQEAEGYLELKTHISKPFLIWDIIHRNLINKFSRTENILYSTRKRGMWEILVLYDAENECVLSFMSDSRFKEIKKSRYRKTPQYLSALLQLNHEFKVVSKQQTLLLEVGCQEKSDKLVGLLNELCLAFTCDTKSVIKQHVLVAFSAAYGRLASLNAYVLDSDLEIYCKNDWMNEIKPVMTNIMEQADKSHEQKVMIKIKPKAEMRIKKEEIIALKGDEEIKANSIS
jgi:hypothetical protein